MHNDKHPHWRFWYEDLSTGDVSLRQGDIFRDLSAYGLSQDLQIHNEENAGIETPQLGIYTADWILFSASCDLDRPGSDYYPWALVGRVVPATSEKNLGPGKLDERIEVVRRGNDLVRFLLSDHPEATPAFPLSVVNFRPHLTLPIEFLRRAAARRPRLRLRHPFREQFGNWVGSNFSRVGVEVEQQIPTKGGTLSASKILTNADASIPVLHSDAKRSSAD